MSFVPEQTPAPSGNIEDTLKDTTADMLESKAKDALPENVSKIANKAQQAASAVNTVKNLTKGTTSLPSINGFNGNVPFDQLDTSAATATAMANSVPSSANSIAATAAGILSTRIVASVSINGNTIHEVLSIQINQEIGGHNELKLRFFHDQVQASGTMIMDGAEKLLGQVAEVELYDANGVSPEKFQNLFVIADVRFEQDALNEGVLHVIGYSPTWLLDGAPHFETFYKKNLSTIVKDSVSQSLPQVKASLKVDPTITETIPFVCRYNESVWNFLKRLSVETGQWLYFNGKELVFGKPEALTGTKIVYGHNCSRINMSLSARPVQQGLFDYEAEAHRPINASANEYSGNAGTYNKIAFNKSKELFGTTPSVGSQSFLPAKQSTLEAIGKSRSAQSAAGMYYVTGETTVHDLRVGINANVDLSRMGQTANHAPICITQIEHHWDITGKYYNRFEAIPAAAEVPPSIPYHKPLTYPMLAQVIDNKDSRGRVRVKFMGWKQEGIPETDFIRVLTPDAGGAGDKVATNRGLVTVPEVGDQVYVDFESGNPDRPFVTGSVFHGKIGAGGGDTNKTKSLTTRSGSNLTLDDSKGSAKLEDPSGNIVTLNGDGTITISAPNSVTINTKDFVVNAGNSISLNALPGPKGGGEGTFDITAKKTITATAQTEDINIKAIAKSIIATAPAMNIELKAAAGKVDIQSKDITIIATATSTFTSTASTSIAGKPIQLNQG
jgi:type VI secretion system secreted protein VgrG